MIFNNSLILIVIVSTFHFKIGSTSNFSDAITIFKTGQKISPLDSNFVRISTDSGKDSSNSTTFSRGKIRKILRRNHSSRNVESTSSGGFVERDFVPIRKLAPSKNIPIKNFKIGNEHDVEEIERTNSGEILPLHEVQKLESDQLPAWKNDSFKVRNQWKLPLNIEMVAGIVRRLKKLVDSLPKWLSIYPTNWMKQYKLIREEDSWREENGVEKTENPSIWSKLNLVPIGTSEKSAKTGLRSSGKIRKLLNLFTIVKFDNSQCQVDDTMGICLHRSECERKGGKFSATCAMNVGVCCYVEKTCGGNTKENLTYFVNEGYPRPSTATPKVCTLNLEKVDPEVKQFRLEFLNFQLRDPENGTCLQDRMIVTGQDVNKVIPDICGSNGGQHVYVDVDDSDGPYQLNIVTMSESFPRNFRIQIMQLKRGDEFLAPKNCIQYYTKPEGIVQSFNYKRNSNQNSNQVATGYFNNLNYAICIEKMKGFCSISYENKEDVSTKPTFQLTNVDQDGQNLLPPMQAGAEMFDCPDDYIILGGTRFCGEKLNDGFVEANLTKNYPVTDASNGPFLVNVRTNAAQTGRGFYLTYKQNPC